MQLWLHLSLDFDPNSFSFFMHLHHLAYRGQQFPGIIFISRPLSHPCAIYIRAETRVSRATLFVGDFAVKQFGGEKKESLEFEE